MSPVSFLGNLQQKLIHSSELPNPKWYPHLYEAVGFGTDVVICQGKADLEGALFFNNSIILLLLLLPPLKHSSDDAFQDICQVCVLKIVCWTNVLHV